MDIQKYEQVMQRIKGRTEYVKGIYSSAESMGKVSVYMVESICLQLRMTIKDIAVACIIANSSEMPGLAHKLRKKYNPKLILKSLEELNSECYPIPVEEGDWLTKDEAISAYGKLSQFIHQNLKYYEDVPSDFRVMYQYTQDLTTKIFKLLSHHHITVLDENKMYRGIMSTLSDGEIQVAEFKRIEEKIECTINS